MKNITLKDIENKLETINLIDVREVVEYEMGHVPGAKNIPMNTLIQNPTKMIKKDQEYYIVCQSGGRSQMVCMMLDVQGYNVTNVIGGTSAFRGKLEY